MRWLYGALPLLCSLLWTVSPIAASAQPAEDPARVAQARQLFDAGGRAYDGGDFATALQMFQQAYAVVPRSSILFSMGQARRRLYSETRLAVHRDEALRLYREYLKAVPTGGRRASAVAGIAEVEVLTPVTTAEVVEPVGRKTGLFITTTTPELKIVVQGGKTHPANEPIELPAGKYGVRLEAEGFVAQELTLPVEPGELTAVSRDLTEKPGGVRIRAPDGASISVDGRYVADAPLDVPLELPPGEHFIGAQLSGHVTHARSIALARAGRVDHVIDMPQTAQRTASHVLLSSSGAVVAISAVLGSLAYVRQTDAQDVLAQPRALREEDLEAYEAARADRDRLGIASAVTGGVGVIGGLVGLGLLLVDPPERLPTPGGPAPRPTAPAAPTAPDDQSLGVNGGPRGTVGIGLVWRY